MYRCTRVRATVIWCHLDSRITRCGVLAVTTRPRPPCCSASLHSRLCSLVDARVAADAAADSPQAGGNAACALDALTSLLHVNIAGNTFRDPDVSLALLSRARFPRILELDFRQNPLPPEVEAREACRIAKVILQEFSVYGSAP